MTYISQFLLAYKDSIETSSLLSDMLYIEFKQDVTPEHVLRLFAGLITFAHPTKATIYDTRKVRIEF